MTHYKFTQSGLFIRTSMTEQFDVARALLKIVESKDLHQEGSDVWVRCTPRSAKACARRLNRIGAFEHDPRNF